MKGKPSEVGAALLTSQLCWDRRAVLSHSDMLSFLGPVFLSEPAVPSSGETLKSQNGPKVTGCPFDGMLGLCICLYACLAVCNSVRRRKSGITVFV